MRTRSASRSCWPRTATAGDLSVPVYSQSQAGIRFPAVLENIDLPASPSEFDPQDASSPHAAVLYVDFRRPNGSVVTRHGVRSDRSPSDPDGSDNDNEISWTSSTADPLIAGIPGIWHYRARAVSGTAQVTSPDWIRFEVL